MSSIQDLKLELQFLSSLADLSTYDMVEAKKFVENRGMSELEFAKQEHWNGYAGIAKCISAGIPCTADNLCREIAVFNQSQSAFITKTILSSDGNGGYLDGYSDKLLEIAERREGLRLVDDARERILSGNGSIAEVKYKLSNSLLRTRGRKATTGLDEHVRDLEKHMEDVAAGRIKPVNPWYIPDLDREIGGLQKTLCLVGAEPGVGKSALFASGVNLQAKNGHRPLILTLEDPPDWLAYRCVSHDSKVNQFDLRFTKVGNGTYESIKLKNDSLQKYRKNIRIIDGSDSMLRIEDIASSINDAIVNEGCDSVWLDHVGEIALTSMERTDLEISRHYSILRSIANKHGVPVIAAAHFKRPSDPSAPPTYRDFANSSGAERKARVALGLKRNPGSDILSVHVMKQTNGPAGQVIDLEFGGSAAMIIETEGGFK
jgi:replicative DNA helicase